MSTEPLPPGWAWVAVDDLAANETAAITDGPFGSNLKSSHYTDEGPKVIRLQNIGDGLFLREDACISEAHFESLRKHEAKANDVVVAMLGEVLPRACMVPVDLGPAIVKADCVRLRVEVALADPKFVMGGLNSEALRAQAGDLMHGVGRPRLGLRWFRELLFPLAPLPEQHRIVEALDSYLSRLDESVALLERVQRNLKRYRASVLQAAVTGKLVPTEAELARAEGRDYEPASVLLERILAERRRRWAESGKKSKYEEPAAPDTTGLPELPEGWCWAKLSAIADVQLGQQRHPTHAAAEQQLPYIRAANITWTGLSLTDVKSMGFPDPVRYSLEEGDLLLSEASGSPMEAGKPAVWRGEIPGACYQKTLIRIRPFDKGTWHPDFGRAVFLGDCITGKFARAAPGVGIVHLTAERMIDWPVPLAPVGEQRRVVAALDRAMTVADALSRDAMRSVRRCTRLRQSILKWAFEGKLADQDPADEPAADLLARIKADRAAVAAPKAAGRGRKKTP